LIDRAKPEEDAKKLLADLGIAEGEKLIGIQAGASMKERRWPSEKFAQTADILSERWNAKILLFGAASEKELVDEVAAKMLRPYINLAGGTTLEQLIGIVQRCSLLVTNDTATMHIAAAVGTPITALFLVHAYAAETGPYCEGAVTLEPDISCFPCQHSSQCPHYACLDYITPQNVADAADICIAMKNGHSPEAPDDRFPAVRVMTTYFDEMGFLDSRPLKKMPIRENDILGRMYRYLFMRALTNEISADFWKKPLERHCWPEAKDETAKWVEKERVAFRKLAETASEGRQAILQAQRDYKSGRLDKVKLSAKNLVAIDGRIEMAGYANPELMPIVRLFIMGKGNMGDTSIEVMFGQTEMLYTEAKAAAESMIRMLGELAAARPDALGDKR
jgi:hypothetical protein